MPETAGQQTDYSLAAPNAEGNVWPGQSCPAFIPRSGAAIGMQQCWYCRHADFHLNKPRALDVGVCCWPKKVLG